MKFAISSLLLVNLLIQITSSLKRCFDSSENLLLTIIVIALSASGLIGLTIKNRFMLLVFAISSCLILIATTIIYSVLSNSITSVPIKQQTNQLDTIPDSISSSYHHSVNSNFRHWQPSESPPRKGHRKQFPNKDSRNKTTISSNTTTSSRDKLRALLEKVNASPIDKQTPTNHKSVNNKTSRKLNKYNSNTSNTNFDSSPESIIDSTALSPSMLISANNEVDDNLDYHQPTASAHRHLIEALSSPSFAISSGNNHKQSLAAATANTGKVKVKSFNTNQQRNNDRKAISNYNNDENVDGNENDSDEHEDDIIDIDNVSSRKKQQLLASKENNKKRAFARYQSVVSQSIDLVIIAILAFWMALLIDEDSDWCFGSGEANSAARRRRPLVSEPSNESDANVAGSGRKPSKVPEVLEYNYNGVRYSIRPDDAVAMRSIANR